MKRMRKREQPLHDTSCPFFIGKDVCSSKITLLAHTRIFPQAVMGQATEGFLLTVEFEKIFCTDKKERCLRDQDNIFMARVMEKCIVQWKASFGAMESWSQCNGKLIITITTAKIEMEKYAILE